MHGHLLYVKNVKVQLISEFYVDVHMCSVHGFGGLTLTIRAEVF